MILAHSADLHITQGPRLADTTRVLEWMFDDAKAAGAAAWSLAGDFFGTTIPHRGTPEEKLALANLIRRFDGPIFVERGNHESPLDFELYPLLMDRVAYAAMPRLSALSKSIGIVQAPYPFKAAWIGDVVPDSIEEQNALAATRYLSVLRNLVEEGRTIFKTLVLLGHFNVVGSITGGGEVLSGHEVELTVDQLHALKLDLYLLGHIHKCQEVGERIWYAGSPTAQSFGEQSDRKAYLLAHLDGKKITVEVRYTPAPILWTLEATYEAAGTWNAAWPLEDDFLPNSECRLIASVPEALRAGVTTTALEAELKRRGVARVFPELRTIPQTSVRAEAVMRAETMHDKLAAYAAIQDPVIDDARLARLQALLAELAVAS